MTEATPAAPESAPTLELGRRLFARQARAESRLSPWTRRDLAGKSIVRELRFAQRIARRVYGRGAPGVTFEGQLSPNAPRGVARFSEKVAERNTLADVARKYVPADDAGVGDAPKMAANAPMPLAGAGEGSAPRNSGPAISAAEALQRLAVVRPDLDPDASPFAKIFKAATSGGQPSESTVQRASDSARRVMETFQRGGPRPTPDSAPKAPIQPRTERPPAPIQRRADPSASAAPLPPAATPPPERPPAAPSSKAIRRFAKVEEVVPANFTPPSDDFGDDLPEPGGPAMQRGLSPAPGEAMPLARRPEAPPAPTRAPPTVAQVRRSAPPAPAAPKRQARPAPAPARLQRRAAAPAARPASAARPSSQVDRGREAPGLPNFPRAELPAPSQPPASDAQGEPAERLIDAPSDRDAARPAVPIQRKPDVAHAPPANEDRPLAPSRPAATEPRSPLETGPGVDPSDVAPASSPPNAPPRAPIQRKSSEASAGDLPLVRPELPESLHGDTLQRKPVATEPPAPEPRPASREGSTLTSRDVPPSPTAARALPEVPTIGTPAQRTPTEPSPGAPAREAASATLPPAQIQRAPSPGQTAELPIARPAPPPTERPPAEGPGPASSESPPPSPEQHQAADTSPAPMQRRITEDRAAELPLAHPPEAPSARPPAAPAQRQSRVEQPGETPLAPLPEPPTAPPASPIQRKPIADQPADLPLARASEPPATPPASPIQRQAPEDLANALPPARPSEPRAMPPAASIQRTPTEGGAADLPLARSQESAPPPVGLPPASIQPQPDDGQPPKSPLIRPPEAPAGPPAAPIQRQPSDGPTALPLARPPTPDAPQPPVSGPQIQAKETGSSTAKAPRPEERGEAPAKPAAIRPRPSALNLARRAVQRILGEEAQPAAPAPGDVLPRSGPGEPAAQIVRRDQEPPPDFALRRVPSIPANPPEPGPSAPTGPTAWAETRPGAPRATPIPARIQRTPAPMPRGGPAIAARPDTEDNRRSVDRDDSLPLVVPLLAAQSQSASRHVQRSETTSASGESATRAAPQKAVRRTVEPSTVGSSSEAAPESGPAPVPDQPPPARGNEPDLNYDLLAQRVYPFIRRLLAFERERERGS